MTPSQTLMNSIELPINSVDDVVLVRQAARNYAAEIGFGLADQTRIATTVSELARNIIQYAGTGESVISDVSDLEHLKIHIVLTDNGKGIDDIDQALVDGFSSGNGLGAGLPGCRRLMDHFHIESSPETGTKVEIELHALR